MTKEELKKATGQELIEQRNYCGVDGYYGDYLDDVNAEMLKRFNRLAELEKENAELEEKLANAESSNEWYRRSTYGSLFNLITKAKEIIIECIDVMSFHDCEYTNAYKEAKDFILKDCEVEK